jgi:AraC-like DNA-binding protein/quercetin dioxygenase-like cupin family protein
MDGAKSSSPTGSQAANALAGPRRDQTHQANVDRVQALQEIPRPVVAAATDYPAGQATRWHSHPRAQLVYGISGVMAVTTVDGVWVVPPERAVWVPGDMPHRVDFPTDVKMRSLWVRADAARNLPRACSVVTVSPLLRELIRTAVDLPAEYDADGPAGRLMAVILDQLEVLDQAPLHLPWPEDARLVRIAEKLVDDPANGARLEDWAKTAGASARTLARLFVKQTGMTFGAWRQQARLLKALELLAAGQGVTATALDLGYDSPSAFIAMFKKALGVSPGKYFG